MKELTIKYKNSYIPITIEGKIGSGSYSNVYNCKFEMMGKIYSGVAKLSRYKTNYLSTNLQRYSYEVCAKINSNKIRVPQIYAYATHKEYGDVLLLEKMENICSLDCVMKNNIYNKMFVISYVAKAIAKLHMLKISGYDVEFYWNTKEDYLVLLDISPINTINSSVCAMVNKHISIEKNHLMGLWNIISQILPAQDAIFLKSNKNLLNFDTSDIYLFLENQDIHIINTARTNALSLLGRLNPEVRMKCLAQFVKVYLAETDCNFTRDNQLYLTSFIEMIASGKQYAKAKLYYAKKDVLSVSSCEISMNSNY